MNKNEEAEPKSQKKEEDEVAKNTTDKATNFTISLPVDNRRGGLGDNIGDELRKLPGGKYPANIIDGVSKFIAESPLIVKATNKIRSLPGGNTAVNVMGKAYGTITSKPVLRTIKATSAIVSMVNFPIGTVVGGLSLVAIGGNVLKETLDVRKIHRLDAKIKNLESIKKNKQQEVALIVENKKTIGKDALALQEFLDSKMPDIYPQNIAPDVPFEGSRLKEFGRAIRDSSLAATSLIIKAAEFGNPAGIVAAVATGVVGTLKEADSNLARRKQINNKKNEVNKLHLNVEHYENAQHLKELELQERVKAETLKEFLSCTEELSKGLPDELFKELSEKPFDKLSKEDFERIYDEKKKEIEKKDEFQLPKRTRIQKAKSAVRAGWGYFAESQLGDLKNLYSKKKTQTPVTPNVDKKPEQEKLKEKEEKLEQTKQEKKAREVQQKLSKSHPPEYKNGKSSSSVSPPKSPDVSNHRGTSKGHVGLGSG